MTTATSFPTGGASALHGAVRGARRPSARQASLLAVAVGLAVVVAHDGTPAWQVVRVAATALGAAAVWRAAAGASLLGIGILAVPVGVGIGGPHVVKAGSPALAAGGTLLLLGGVAALVLGVAGLVHRSHPLRAVLIAVATVVACGVAVWTLAPAVAATNVPRPALGDRTPADLGLPFEHVRFDARDGVPLSGWYIPSRTGAAVVLLHGAGSTRSNVLDHAAVLARDGFGVLLYDARGHGRSAGRAMDFGWHGDDDIAGAVGLLRRRPDVDPGRIAAVGMSMGGESAIGAAASIPGIRAVVAEGATNRVAGDKGWLSDEYGARGAVTEWVASITTGITDLLTEASPPRPLRDAASLAAPRPMLLIAAGDVTEEPLAARWIAGAAPASVRIWVAPDTGHTDALRTHPDAWERRVTTFLRGALR